MARPSDVARQLSADYPENTLAWVKKLAWDGPKEIALDQVDYSNRKSWNAWHEPERVAKMAHKIEKRSEQGRRIKPVVLVDTPGKSKLKVVDGHHRALAYQRTDRPVWGYTAKVSETTGPWDEFHAQQFDEQDRETTDDFAAKSAWPAWEQDRVHAAVIAESLQAALSAAVDTQAIAHGWRAVLATQALTPGAPESYLDRWSGHIAAALEGVLAPAWQQAWQLGEGSAQHVLTKAKPKISIAELVKVGPEGYIHGWICVRPPCGKNTLHLEEGTGYQSNIPGHGMMNNYRIMHGGTGEQVGTVRPGVDSQGGGITFRAYEPNAYTQTAAGDDPESGLKALAASRNLQRLYEEASKDPALREVAIDLRNARHRLNAGEEDRTTELLRRAVTNLDAVPPVLDPRGFSNTKLIGQLRNGTNDLYHSLTGEDLPDERDWKIPDEPWAKTGKIRKSQLEVSDWTTDADGDEHATVIHKPTGIEVGTVDRGWINKTQPRIRGQMYNSKLYYTVRHADGNVMYFGASDVNNSGLDKGLARLVDGHNKRLVPQPPHQKVEIPEPLEKPPSWFNADASIADRNVPADTIAETRGGLEDQARYVPNIAARARIYYTPGGASGGYSHQSNAAGLHYTGTGRIYLRPDTFGRKMRDSSSAGYFVPRDKPGVTSAQGTLAHELGHGVADRGFGRDRLTNPELWTTLANAIGVMPPNLSTDPYDRYTNDATINRWIGSNKAKVAREVSTYGTTNHAELEAELWAEYTTAAHPRAAATAYGDYVMAHLPNRLDEPTILEPRRNQ